LGPKGAQVGGGRVTVRSRVKGREIIGANEKGKEKGKKRKRGQGKGGERLTLLPPENN